MCHNFFGTVLAAAFKWAWTPGLPARSVEDSSALVEEALRSLPSPLPDTALL